MKPVELVVYSDYLCPWCYNVSVRMRKLGAEFGDALRIEWRSFLLRPKPGGGRDLERFRKYTRSWERPAAEPESGTFRIWDGEAGPPSHSVPPHQVAKAAARLGREAFEQVHDRLLHTYFALNRDITARETLRQIWAEATLPAERFEEVDDPDLVEEIHREHNEAIELGATGVPAVRRADQDVAITGAFPVEFYRRWIVRALEE